MATEYGKRLKAARTHAGLTQVSLSKATGIAQSTISTAEREGNGSSDTPIYARICGVDAHWLATGEGTMLSPHNNVQLGPDFHPARKYPLISNVQAGDWTEICETLQPSEAEAWMPSIVDLGECGYLLRVNGNSMFNPYGKYSFPHGSILHVNPDAEAVSNQFVVVRRSGENTATFKRLVELDGVRYLEAINPDWPERYLKLQPGDVFCGVVKAATMPDLP